MQAEDDNDGVLPPPLLPPQRRRESSGLASSVVQISSNRMNGDEASSHNANRVSGSGIRNKTIAYGNGNGNDDNGVEVEAEAPPLPGGGGSTEENDNHDTFYNMGSSSAKVTAEFEEECELFHDTFTFLLTAKYPFEEYYCDTTKTSSDEDENYNTSVNEERKEEDGNNNDDAMETTMSHRMIKIVEADPDYKYLPFWVGFLVNLGQLFIYSVVLANVFFRGELPPNADRLLRLAQIFAMVVTLYTQSDFIDGIYLFGEYKLNRQVFDKITTFRKFHYSTGMRVFSGNVGILSTFILVMYSTEVVDLLLNFTAMEFVATLDDSFFGIATKGFLGLTLEKKALEIQSFQYSRRVRRGSLTRLYTYTLYVVLVFSGFFYIVALQNRRAVGVENDVYVQFDYAEAPGMFGISGVYKGCLGFRTAGIKGTGNIGYVDVSYTDCPKLGDHGDNKNYKFPAKVFVYCWEFDGWAFIPEPTDEPCKEGNHLMRSFKDDDGVDADSFDILTHSKANWLVSPPGGGEVLLDFVFIEAVEKFKYTFDRCSTGLAFSGKDIDIPYEPLDRELFAFGDSNYTSFGLMYRDVFQREIKWQLQGKYQVVFFEGLRWIWMDLNLEMFVDDFSSRYEDVKTCGPQDDCWSRFLQYFHRDTTWLFNEEIVFLQAISDPMQFLTASDKGHPTESLKWHEPLISGNAIIPGREIESLEEGGGKYGFQCSASVLTCEDGQARVGVEMRTDSFPLESEIILFIGESIDDLDALDRTEVVYPLIGQQQFTLPENGSADLRFNVAAATYSLATCIPKETNCIQAVILDEYGDGLVAPAQYEITYEGKDAISGDGGDWRCRSYQFGPGCNRTVVPFDCDFDSVINLVDEKDVGFFHDDVAFADFPNAEDCLRENPDDSCFFFTQPPGFGEGSTLPPDFLSCDGGSILQLSVQTDNFPQETTVLAFFGESIDDGEFLDFVSVQFEPTSLGEFNISDGFVTEIHFSDELSVYGLNACIPPETSCIQVVVLDEARDGFCDSEGCSGHFFGTYEGIDESLDPAISEWSCLSYQFGPACQNTSQPLFCE